jgi:ABC-type Mn2+/Zn2+ transport system ATPase subunit
MAFGEGEWQKVAMARAFMSIREAELLILDELSSALDPQAESRSTIFIVCE